MKNASDHTSVSIFSIVNSCVLPALLGCALAAAAQAPAPDSPAIEAKAHAMVAKLSLEQKIVLLGGVDDGNYTRAEPAIGLPRLKFSDGPMGLRAWGPDTAYPGGVALAAAWDPSLSTRIGEAIAKDARSRGVHLLCGPGVNILRSPLDGRNFEYYSEDPFLSAVTVVPFIEGVQAQGVIATVKHFALNNQEYNRHNVSVEVDERTMREIYLPAFEAAVTKAHVDAVMNSYNLVNGVHATESAFLNLKVLKGDWGFQGVLMSDWDATYSGVGAANNGLDLEMPGARFMNTRNLVAAVKNGAVKETTIDDKVLRLVRVALRYGFFDHPQFDPGISTYSVADRAVALDGARESITLLKNEGHLLPLDATKVKTIAVIGPNAYPAVTGGGGSSYTAAFEPVSTLTGIASLLGPNVSVLYSPGLPTISQFFQSAKWDGAVKLETFASRDFTGQAVVTHQASINDWKVDMWGPEDTAKRTIRFNAVYKPATSGKYLLLAAASSEDAYNVLVDGKKVVEQSHAEGQVPHCVTLELTAGKPVNVVAEYMPHIPGFHLGLGIVPEADLLTEEAKQYAAIADVVVVAVGFNPPTEGEGYDRTFELPFGQDVLIEAMAAANPHTIVTLNGGGGMGTQRWLDKVPALLHLYYPGQEGGTALAEVLFGKHNPEGKLPVSFDRSWDKNPSAKFYYPVKGADTALHVIENNKPPVDYVIPHVKYEDGLMVGYRYWTTTGKHPLYPFGFGLSYTTFGFSNLKAPETAASGSTVAVSFDVTNTGAEAGAEVAQLYVSDPSAKTTRPERELKGFEKVRLAPGETRHVTLSLDARAFSYWDAAAHKWTIDPGKFVIRVGDSSENTPLSAELTIN